jgi:hypothetical protein
LISRHFRSRLWDRETERNEMGKHLDARTEWEVDAARRREVIQGDFGAHRLLDAADPIDAETVSEVRHGMLANLRAVLNPPTATADDVPCNTAGAMRTVNPGA